MGPQLWVAVVAHKQVEKEVGVPLGGLSITRIIVLVALQRDCWTDRYA